MAPFLGFLTSAGVAIAALITFIMAIRVSYAIERVTNPRPSGAPPRFTNMFMTVTGAGVAPDDTETRAMVARLRRLLLIVLALLVAGAVGSTTLR